MCTTQELCLRFKSLKSEELLQWSSRHLLSVVFDYLEDQLTLLLIVCQCQVKVSSQFHRTLSTVINNRKCSNSFFGMSVIFSAIPRFWI